MTAMLLPPARKPYRKSRRARSRVMKTSEKAPQTEEVAGTADQADWHWADAKSVKVNPAFQSLIPLQSKGEYLALDQSIQVEGCRDPLIVWKGHNVVLDGHTRRELCV